MKEPRKTITLGKIFGFFDGFVRADRDVAVVAPKDVREYLARGYLGDERDRNKRLDPWESWNGATIGHQGYLVDHERIQGCDILIVIGRLEPPPERIERTARAIFADDPEPLKFSDDGEYDRDLRGYRMRDGSRAGVWTNVHPDPRCQMLLEPVREREIVRAVDQLELINPTTEKEVYIFCNIPVDVTIDDHRSLDEIVGNPKRLGSRVRLERGFRRRGFISFNKSDQNSIHSELYNSIHTAERDIKWLRRDALNGGTFLYRVLLDLCPHLRMARYRAIRGPDDPRKRPGKAAWVLYDSKKHTDPQTSLGKQLGLQIVEFWDETIFQDEDRNDDTESDNIVSLISLIGNTK